MRTLFASFSFIACIFFSALVYAENVLPANENANSTVQTFSAEGYWQTIDDNTNKARSIVHICSTDKPPLLFGQIIQANYDQSKHEAPTDKCDRCDKKDPRYQQPILGMIFITDMKMDRDDNKKWHGKILDPENGKIYSANMTLSNDDESLTVRGYVGISLFGRTQIWSRIDPTTFPTLLGTPLKDQASDDYLRTTKGKYVVNDYDSCEAIKKTVTDMTNNDTRN